MHEILAALGPEDRVLDLGCRFGSFASSDCKAQIVGADLDAPPQRDAAHVRCDARRLPFRAGVFRAAILNHSLEHFVQPQRCLEELGRAVDPNGWLYIAVPDASTFSDRLYRWIGKGGGHVNQFVDREALTRLISEATGMTPRGGRLLHTSFNFANRRFLRAKAPGRLVILAGGSETFLRWMNLAFRHCDRLLRTRLSVYGWALYFGGAAPSRDPSLAKRLRRVRGGRPGDFAFADRLLPATVSLRRLRVAQLLRRRLTIQLRD